MSSIARTLLFGVILFASGLLPAIADDAPASPATPAAPVLDPGAVAAHYRQVLARPIFEDTGDSDLSTRFEDALAQWFEQLGDKISNLKYADRLPAVESLLITLMVVFCAAVVLYIMARLTRRRARIDSQPDEETAGEKTFRPAAFYDREIDNAIRDGDWHAAWLASWRQFLSRLEDGRLVEADRTRTNREYLAQLRDRALPATAFALLAGLVDAYDRFIYGRKAISEADWKQFHGQINETGLLLHLESAALGGPRTP